PVIIGPPRGCVISPTRSPGQPSRLRASAAKRSRKSSSLGWPQLRLRDSRITCQSGPLIGRATAPARQPLAYEPIARAASGAGLGAAPNSSFAGGSLACGALTGASSPDGSFDVVLACCVLAAARRAAVVFGLCAGSATTDPHISNS